MLIGLVFWMLVEVNDKNFVWVKVLKMVCECLESVLKDDDGKYIDK